MRRRRPTRYYLSDGETSLTGTKLRCAGRETKIDAMRTWFFSNYEDPVESTPYDSGEGGYIYVWGGPYKPEEELQDEFGGLISDDLIAELSEELCEISWEWTKHPEYDDTDEYLFESIARSTHHKKSFDEAIGSIEGLLAVRVEGDKKAHLLKLLYVNVITGIESYLSDVFISYVGNDKTLLRKFIETTPEFKTEKVSLAELFKAMDDVEKKARSHLIDIVWHHLNKVKPMYKATLGIDFPKDMKPLFKAVLVRHDIVHRNGKTKEGKLHSITAEDVKELVANAQSFVSCIDNQLANISKENEDAVASIVEEVDF